MTTVVNNPAPTTDSGGNGFLIGVIILIGFVIILLFFGIPALKRMGPVRLNLPAPKVVIPDKINVNINQTK